MQFSTLYGRVESLANVTGQRALIKDAIQIGLHRATAQDLPYLMTEGFITTVAVYETSTVTATDNSATITGASTVFTAAMVGRKIRFGSENAYYRIKSRASDTSITLEAPYQGTGGSGLTYSIYQDEYKLPADMDIYKVMRQMSNSQALSDINPTAFDLMNPSPKQEGSSNFTILAGTKLDTYTTGTVSITVNQSALTGSSTSWTTIEGLGKGTRITIGSYVYTVKSVDSDTAITIYENASATASSATYSASLDNYIIQLSAIPQTTENLYFRYQRIPAPLIDDEDIPDLPDQWHHVLISAGLIWAWETKDKQESKIYEGIFGAQVLEMWQRIGYISGNRSRPRISQDVLANRELPYGLSLPSGYGFPIK